MATAPILTYDLFFIQPTPTAQRANRRIFPPHPPVYWRQMHPAHHGHKSKTRVARVVRAPPARPPDIRCPDVPYRTNPDFWIIPADFLLFKGKLFILLFKFLFLQAFLPGMVKVKTSIELRLAADRSSIDVVFNPSVSIRKLYRFHPAADR